MKIKVGIGLAVALIAVAAGVAAFWPFGHGTALRLPGIVEVQEVRLGSKVGGRVESLLIREGDMIQSKNQPLVIFEAPELKNQRKQMQARLDSAQAELDRAINGPRLEEKEAAAAAAKSAKAKWDRAVFGWRLEEKEQAENDLKTANAEYDQAVKEWDRIVPLYKEKAVARAEYDAALGARDRAQGRKESARWRNEMMSRGSRQEDKDEAEQEYNRLKFQWELLKKGTRDEEIEMAKAKVAELKANIEAIDINLAETTIVSPPNLGKAMVEVIAIRPGDLVQPNQPIIRCLRVEDLWIKVYVPETQYGLVTLNKKVSVTIDSHPGKVFDGVVIQRSNISEFTPRNVQSVDERRHQVFGVKIRVDDPQGVFNAGMAAEVTIALD